MNSAEVKFQQKLEKLKQLFITQLPEKIDALRNHWRTVKSENWSTESTHAFRLIVHSLIGTSGTFGFTEIASTALELETQIKTIAAQGVPPSQEETDIIEQSFLVLCSKLLINPDNHDPQNISITETHEEGTKILIVDDDEEITNIVSDHLELHGFIVEALPHPSDLITTIDKFQPSLILMDMVFSEGDFAGAAAIEALRDNNNTTPVIFISVRDDMASRLSAIRTSAYSYLTKPIDLNLLITNINAACNIKPDLPYRVLIIDDDPEIAELHASALESDGMNVLTLLDPMQTLNEIGRFKPELILLDMYMPECSGLEVAMTIRQNSEFDDIPIVFLSAEQDVSIRMLAIKAGSDDFITKPVNIDYLKRATRARIEKSRQLRDTRNSDKTIINNLTEAKKAAEYSNKTKSEFISKMSHELRTPLNSILGYTQLLELDHDGTLTEQQKSNLAFMHESGWHLLTLINDLLDISKIESGHLSLANTDINLDKIITQSIEMNSKSASEKNISINYDNQCDSSVLVYADATRLQQVIINFLSNAIKFNIDGGQINISVTPGEDNTCKVTISDTGRGLPENNIDSLFTPFNRLGLEKTNIEGSGIGLALSAQLISLMEGKIGAYNNEGSGSSFWFSLKKCSENSENRKNYQRKVKILYIEENDIELVLVRQSLLAHRDVDLVTARDAESAIHLATQIIPDIILLDIELSSMDGHSMLNALRTNSKLRKIPIFALSSHDIPAEQQSLNESEFHCYFSKPYNMKELLKSIDNAL